MARNVVNWRVVGQTFLEAVRHELGVTRLSDLSAEALFTETAQRGVVEAYSRWTDAPAAPPLKRLEELRPAIAVFGISRIDEVAVLARALLLCESAALIVPDTISYLNRTIRMLMLLEPVIERELVCLLPEQAVSGEAHYFNEWSLEQTMLARLRSDASEQEREAWGEQFVVGGEVAFALDACTAFPDRLDLACTRPEQTALLRRWLGETEESVKLRETHDRLRYLPDLLELPLPMFNLPLAELAAVRESGVFAMWRSALSEALREVQAMDDEELLAPASARLEEIRERLLDAAQESVQETRRSRVLKAALTGTVGLAVACATGALAAAGTAASAGAGAAAFSAGQFLSWLGGRPGKGERAFRRLVVHLFPDP